MLGDQAEAPADVLPKFDNVPAPLALANSLAACILSFKLNPAERQWAAHQLVCVFVLCLVLQCYLFEIQFSELLVDRFAGEMLGK